MNAILKAFGLIPAEYTIQRIGSGYIHQTYKLEGKPGYILQRVNINVFKQPEIIAANLRFASKYLKEKFPTYLFLSAIPSVHNSDMVYDHEGFPWRLFPYQANTFTLDRVNTPEEAFCAAHEFARLTRYLNEIDVNGFKETIPQFQDLVLRYQQFESALQHASPERRENADTLIESAKQFYPLVKHYRNLISSKSLQIRIVHNDTKINNILFNSVTQDAVSVIDLDTLMPGYFMYDLGDMVRTFVSPVSEEENDFSKIVFRKNIYEAVMKGYLSQMAEVMTESEKQAIPFSGKMMTYIMALRFLADYLNNDIYYHTTYERQNFVRAGNQFCLLKILSEKV